MTVSVATFYQFFDLPSPEQHRDRLREIMKARGVKGTILLAPEGINGTISGARDLLIDFLDVVHALPGIAPLDIKWSEHNEQPFERSKVKLKPEIIRFDYPLPAHTRRGTHVDAQRWNELVADEAITVLDSRNKYEIHVGTFDRAINPKIDNFTQLKDFISSQLSPKEHPKIATFCTGGVRCEKLSAWMLEQGFEEVYQLDGGILKYLEEIKENDSRWQGDCYVFDDRVAVTHDLRKAPEITKCPACGHALNEHDRSHEVYIPESNCPYC